MSLSYITYPGNGSTKDFDVPFPYLSRAHVRVGYGWDYFEDTLTTELFTPGGFTWISDTRIRLTNPAPSGQELTILRATPKAVQLVEWTDSSTVQAFDHNRADLQSLYAIQELNDRSRFARANLILVPAGATDAALAAAFADAAANDKKIVFSEDTTVKIPTVAATIQAVCELVVPTVNVEILIESGHEIENANTLSDGDYGKFRITSIDAEVKVGTSLPATQGVVQCFNATALQWDVLLDCDGLADYGLALFNSRGYLAPAKGIRKARRANLFATQSSTVSAPGAPGVGSILADGLEHGAWITWSSSLSCHLTDFRNNGSANSDGYGIFASRGSHIQADRADYRGSANGIRNGRSIVCSRIAKFDGIPGYSIVVIELGFTSASVGSFDNCGTAGNGKSILQVGFGAGDRDQSGGQINAESSTFNNAKADHIAEVIGGDGYINIDNCSGTGIEKKLALVSRGTITCNRGSYSVAASNESTELILSARGGRFQSFATIFDGGGTVRNVGRALGDGFLSLDSALSTNFTEAVIARLEDAGTCYARGASHNGSTNVLQRGTNANGGFARYSDGTQHCWAWLEVTNIAGDGKRMSRTWNYPAAFVEPLVSISVTGTISRRNSNNAVVGTTDAKLKDCELLSGATSAAGHEFFVEINSTAVTTFVTGDTCWIRAHAIGRWF